MNLNEPVAWLLFRDGEESYPQHTTSYKQMREWETYLGDNERIEPHYIHPVKEQANPVAWRSQSPDGYWIVYQAPVEGAEPLYTGFKELTDEEILCEGRGCALEDDWERLEFARAILRKAQEK